MHTCPRRAESGMIDGPFKGAGENLDKYVKPAGLVTQERGCSYCGSMPPDDFMAKVREGFVVGPTDKSYKAYLHEPPAPDGDASLGGPTIGKFYFQHLSTAQHHEFIALLNDKTMKVGYPGHFYVLPFFVTPA